MTTPPLVPRDALADAWDEGHRTPRLLDWDAPPCLCHAYSESECACGNYGATKPTPNPYREDPK